MKIQVVGISHQVLVKLIVEGFTTTINVGMLTRLGIYCWGGEIPQDYDLHHTCENRLCVNPEHLIPVTKSQHHADLSPTHIAYKNKHKTHCPQGHPYTEDNFVKGNVRDKGRSCKICANAKTVAWQKAKRQNEKEQGVNPDKRYKFTEDELKEIANSPFSTKDVMVKYGISGNYLWVTRRKYKITP